MKKPRMVARLDIKGPNVIKGIHLEGLRVVGKPNELAKKYYLQGADELLYIDTVASLYSRDSLINVVKNTTKDGVFIPMTVGGGVRTLEDINELLRAGADKVAINTEATKNPKFIREAAEKFGSQCIVASIEAISVGDKKWEAYIECGREETGLDVIEWAKKLEKLGAGEILLTSIDKEGTKEGFEDELIEEVSKAVSIPLIVCGGAGKVEDVIDCFKKHKVDAIAIASLLHYNLTNILEIKGQGAKNGVPLRYENKLDSETKIKNKNVISIIDYDAGNLRSVCEAFKFLGQEVKLITTQTEIEHASHLVLPGVGAYGEGMSNLKKNKLDIAIKEHVKKGKPFLGICLGAELLLSESEEFGKHEGLNIIPGKVLKFKDPSQVNGVEEWNYRVPHIGWNNIKNSGKNWENSIFSHLNEGNDFYFVHSYYMKPDNEQHIFLNSSYGDEDFCAVVKKDNVIGSQFHPEKSGALGLEILKKFCNMEMIK